MQNCNKKKKFASNHFLKRVFLIIVQLCPGSSIGTLFNAFNFISWVKSTFQACGEKCSKSSDESFHQAQTHQVWQNEFQLFRWTNIGRMCCTYLFSGLFFLMSCSWFFCLNHWIPMDGNGASTNQLLIIQTSTLRHFPLDLRSSFHLRGIPMETLQHASHHSNSQICIKKRKWGDF